MENYNPHNAPNPEEWLALDEEWRIALIEQWHIEHDNDLPNIRLHATFHAIVENQLAEKMAVVQKALTRLLKQGLKRHEAIHAIAAVFTKHFYNAMQGDPGAIDMKLYKSDLKKLTAKRWRKGKY